MPDVVDRELATLVRERLDARRPRRLPQHFVPPPERQHRYRWTAALVAAFLLGLSVAVLVRPDVGRTLLSGVLGRPSATPAAPARTGPPQHTPGAPTASPGTDATPAPSPEPTPAPQPGTPAAPAPGTGAAPTPAPSGDVIQLPLPPLPLPTPSGGIPIPVPSLPLPPLPLPTASGGVLPPLLPSPGQ